MLQKEPVIIQAYYAAATSVESVRFKVNLPLISGKFKDALATLKSSTPQATFGNAIGCGKQWYSFTFFFFFICM